MYILADSSIQNPGGKVDMGTGPALVYHPPGISSECKAREKQLGVDQVPGQCGSELKPVIFRDLYVISVVCTRQLSVNKNSLGWSLVK